MELVEQVYRDPDETRPSATAPDREVRSRLYDRQQIEIVVDLGEDPNGDLELIQTGRPGRGL